MPIRYANRPDMRSRTAMTQFLTNHFRYHTLNSWNNATSYANRVKLYDLGIPEDRFDTAAALVCGELHCPDWDETVRELIAGFRDETGYDAGFNGRSGGYLVLYATSFVPAAGTYLTTPGVSIDRDEDFLDWDMGRIRDRVRLVDRFDRLCDDLRGAFLDILERYAVEEIPVTTIRRMLVPPEEQERDAAGEDHAE